VLALGIGASLFFYRESRERAEAQQGARIQRAVARVQTALKARFGGFEDTLRGAAGFFVSTDEVTQAEFRRYWDELGFATRNPSVASLSYLVPVEGRFLVQYREGLQASGEGVGFDAGAVPGLRAALEDARDSGSARVVTPVSPREHAPDPTFAIEYPIFRDLSLPASPEDRRLHLLGWVSMIVAVNPLMSDVLSGEDAGLAVSLLDGADPGTSALLYLAPGSDAAPGARRRTAQIALGGHPFTTAFVVRPGFGNTESRLIHRELLLAGLLITALLFGIIWSLNATKARALTLAGEMTESLRASEQRYGRLFEQSLAGIYRTTPDGRILECNEALARFFGYESRQDLLDHSAVALHESAETRQRFLEALREKGTLIAYESRARRKDGTFFWTLEHVSLLPGPPEVIEGTIVDISKHKEAEEALRLSRERYRSVIESSRDGLLFFDLATRRVLESNPAFQRMLGYSAEELSALSLYDFAPDDRASVDANIHRLVDQETRTIPNRAFRRKDGKEVTVEIDAILIEESGRRTVFNVVHNLAERRALEEQLRQAQKMEAVGRLAGGVAHDFNNLLTAILGYAELLLDSDATDDVRNAAGEIRKAGERAAALTKQLLAFSRKQVLQPKIVDLNDVLAEVDGILHRVLGEDIALEAERDPHLWVVLADPGQLQQVLLNLAVNARDAMPEGGVLRIATRNVSLRAANLPEVPTVAEGDYVLLEVADTGHGMDAETLSRVFEPFFTTKERGKGTGLGLSTVYGIVKQSGGYIHIESEPGKGTRVLVYLTRVHGAADSPLDVTPRSLPRGGTETILLVEDEESVRRLASLLLERSGYRLLVASSAEEALETARGYAGQIDLLLTDIVLPGLNGRRLADLLSPERPSMKVVFASGYFDERGILEPGSDFIQKPFNPETLARTIRRALDRKGSQPA